MEAQLPERTVLCFIDGHNDTSIWDTLRLGEGDVLVNTYGKSGTTWMQQICRQIYAKGVESTENIHLKSPWVEMKLSRAKVESLASDPSIPHKIFKSHAPLTAIHYQPHVKYIHVVRECKDALVSYHNHLQAFQPDARELLEQPAQETTLSELIQMWLVDGKPLWPYFDHVKSWWQYRHLPNILILHYQDLLDDLEGNVRRVAAFLEQDLIDDEIKNVVHQSSFAYMKQNEAMFQPSDAILVPGHFINKGTNKRWKDLMTSEEVQAFENAYATHFSPELIEFVKYGSKGPSPPIAC
ncbi:P-loop containing nucleoside triphosphate hydrolase protein [Rhizoclosmatium globosum]|uniref:p-loop containing nucleoside triphosphate hydrolase protein n=1 Tax=Rhizoclosmatium globosum TaxID=329046 RepID=A0A1Y2B287_9FUNG|nr:P-loop containing nucleoside triphosphate hydrolase protein [Rhizoclosmatium globosum]|eukprot:ORY28923.1 P-loop containing nucleoside triphosphate hydrolase protein [Rhizoclosmatium globosum]